MGKSGEQNWALLGTGGIAGRMAAEMEAGGRRFYNKALAGGTLLDIGVYAISLARYFMDSAPGEVTSKVRFAPSGTDESSGIIMVNEQGQMAVLSVSLHAKQPKRAVISCDKAYIEIMEYPCGDEAVIVYTETGTREMVKLGEQGKALLYESEDMERAVNGDETVMQLPLTIDVMNVMTGIRKEWGMVYDSEKTV